jgi:toxin FitB
LILLDTNVLSELVRPRPDPRVVIWTRHSAAALAIPTIAVAEMAFGIEKLAEGRRREDLLAGLHRLVTEFADRLFDFNVKAAWAYGRPPAARRRHWTWRDFPGWTVWEAQRHPAAVFEEAPVEPTGICFARSVNGLSSARRLWR